MYKLQAKTKLPEALLSFAGLSEGKKTSQVARCGNAVCPPMAEAVVRANLPEWCGGKITTMEELRRHVAV